MNGLFWWPYPLQEITYSAWQCCTFGNISDSVMHTKPFFIWKEYRTPFLDWLYGGEAIAIFTTTLCIYFDHLTMACVSFVHSYTHRVSVAMMHGQLSPLKPILPDNVEHNLIIIKAMMITIVGKNSTIYPSFTIRALVANHARASADIGLI